MAREVVEKLLAFEGGCGFCRAAEVAATETATDERSGRAKREENSLAAGEKVSRKKEVVCVDLKTLLRLLSSRIV
jgi:hypothetical protein